MLLEGSCHCGAVSFSVESHHPYPYNLCYCSICRKTAGTGGYAINLRAETENLKIKGEEHIRIYQAIKTDPETGEKKQSSLERRFCVKCGSALWAYDANWPEMIHPHSGAIDTPLPVPPERVHLMTGSKASWVEVEAEPQDKCFEKYPDESIEDWHQRLGLVKA
jgi:hypothetical protein